MPSDVSIRITTKDASQADLRKAGQELDALGGKAKSAGKEFDQLGKSAKNAGEELGLVGEGVEEVGEGVDQLGGSAETATHSFEALALGWKKVAAALLALEGLRRIGSYIVNVNAKFERQSVVLKRLLGSQEASAAAMERLSLFARKTPFELENVNQAFLSLTSFGIDANKNLRTLGDTAAAMGKPLQQAVEALADAVTGEFERLKEFGIRARVEGDKVAFEYSDNAGKMRRIAVSNSKDIIEDTLRAIWNEKYSGAMEDLSTTWDGLWSNLKDTAARGARFIGKDLGVFGLMKGGLQTVLNIAEGVSDAWDLVGSSIKAAGRDLKEFTQEAARFELSPGKGLRKKPREPVFGELPPGLTPEERAAARFPGGIPSLPPTSLEVPELTPAQLKAEEEFEAEVFGEAKRKGEAERDAAKKSAEEQIRSLLKARDLRIELLRLKGDEIGALEAEREAQLKTAATGEEKAQILMVFEARLLKVREAAHQRVMKMMAEELQAGKAAVDEEEAHRRAGLDERQQLQQDILEARTKDLTVIKAIAKELDIEGFLKSIDIANVDTRKLREQFEKFRAQNKTHEDEAQGQLAELADQWRATGGQMEDVIDRFFGRFTSGLSGLRGEFSDFGDFLLDLLSSIGGQAAKEFLGEKVKGIFGRITGFLGDLLGIKREPTFGQPGGPPGPPQQGQQAALTGAGLIQGGASIASLAGQFIPGRAGSIISGAGSGAMLGFQIGGPIGAGIGAAAGGLLGGIFGGGDKQKDPVRRAIKEWVSGTLWPALQELKRLGFGPGGFGSFAPSGTTFFKALGFESGIPQQLLADMKRMADAMKSVISEALERGFSSFSISAGWERFLRNIRRGLADYIGDAFRDAIVRGGLLSQAIAPFVQETAKLTRRFRKGRISGPELESGILASFAQALPGIEALEPVFERLAGISRTITSQVSGQTRGTFISVPVTVHANIASGMDARMVGENLAYGVEMKLKQSMALGIA